MVLTTIKKDIHMFKCFCWLFWSSEPNFLNIYWSKAMEEITWKSQIYGNIWIQTVSQSEPCRACFPCSKKDNLRAQIDINRAKQTRKSRFEKWLVFFLYMPKPSSLEEPWRRASVPDAWLSLLPFFFFFHIDLIQSTHFSSFFNSYLGTLKSCVSSLLSTCTYLWASVQMS